MPDPRVLQPATIEYYARPLASDFYRHHAPSSDGSYPLRSSPEAMLRSLNQAHTNMRKLVKANDQLRHDYAESLRIVKAMKTRQREIFWSMVIGIFLMALDMVLR